MNRSTALAAFTLLTVVACGDDGEPRVQVAAAADLRSAFEAMQPDLEQACACRITFIFGSSGLLREQVAAGANFAVYFSADEAFVQSLVDIDAVLPDTVARYAVGRIVLSWRDGIEPVRTVEELTREDIQRVAIANPAHAPYGQAAQAAMEQVGVWDAVLPRIVYGENIRQATDYVESGDADAGIVALPLVINTDTPYEVIPDVQHPPILQGAAVVRGVNEPAGRAILDYVTSEAGQARLREFGFEPAR